MQSRIVELTPQKIATVLSDCRALTLGICSDPPTSITGMSADERDSLANILTNQFTRAPDGWGVAIPAEAMLAWLMVQSARLRAFSPDAKARIYESASAQLAAAGSGSYERMNINGPRARRARLAAEATVKDAHEASKRPEYAIALNNFLKYLNPSEPLDPSLRSQVMNAFNHQRTTEKTISRQVNAMVDLHGIEMLARQGYRLSGRTGEFRPTAAQAGRTRAGPSAPPEVLQPSGPAGSGLAGRLPRSDSTSSQQSIPDVSEWMAQARSDLPR